MSAPIESAAQGAVEYINPDGLPKNPGFTQVVAVAVTPGFLRSEAMLEHFGVTEDNWRDGKRDKFLAFSDTPHYIGRAVVALAADPQLMDKTGQTVATWDLAQEYGFTDADGTQPHWQRNYEAELKRRGV